MDKLRILPLEASLGRDLVRFYNEGPLCIDGLLAFPTTALLCLVAARTYELAVTGDLTVQPEDGGDEYIRYFTLGWKDDARDAGKGEGTLNLITPDAAADKPCRLKCTLGAASYQDDPASPVRPVRSGEEMSLGDWWPTPFVTQMLLHEAAHQWMGDVVGLSEGATDMVRSALV